MMNLSPDFASKRTRVLGFCTLLAVLAALVLAEINHARGVKMLETYLVLIPAFFTGMMFLMPLRRSHDYWLGLAWMGWFVLSRVLLGDLYFVRSSYEWFVLEGLAYVFALPFAWLMRDGERKLGLELAAFALVIAISAMSWLAVISGVRDQITTIAHIGGTFGLVQYGTKYSIRLTISPHANISAALIGLAIMLGVWLIASRRRKWLAALLFLPLFVGLYTAFALTMSRTNMIQLAFFAAMLAALLLIRKIPRAARLYPLKIASVLAASLVLFAVVFESSYWVVGGFNAVQKAVFNQKISGTSAELTWIRTASAEEKTETVKPAQTPKPEKKAEETKKPKASKKPKATKTPKPTKEPKLWQVRERPLEKDLSTMTGRTKIYREVIGDLLSNPKKLLLGVTNVEAAMPGTYAHAHNAFLQVTVCLGLPALLMALWFCIRAAWLSGRIVLVHLKTASAADLVLVCAILSILIGTIPETYLFYNHETRLYNVAYFLLYGYLIETERRLRKAS